MKHQLKSVVWIGISAACLGAALSLPAWAAEDSSSNDQSAPSTVRLEPSGGLASVAVAVPSTSAITPGLSTEQIVDRLEKKNAERAAALRGWDGSRFYELDYHGFPGSRDAEMEVQAHYKAPEEKDFQVVSSRGSKLIQHRVFEKLLESEREAQNPENQRETALTSENYSFSLLGTRPSPYGGCYLLKVEPKRHNKFLYRGEICVNAQDFAVESIDAEPAKNPSFWIKKTRIEHHYEKVGEFWLPASNKTVSHIRLGGTATLSILYKNYQIQ